MTGRRLSADAQARLDFAIAHLSAAYRLQQFAQASGSRKELAPDAMRSLERDVDRAREGKSIARYDAFGGRGRWKNRKEAA